MKKRYLLALIALITFITFSPTLHNDFTNWDDDINVTENSHVTTGLSVSNIVWAFTTMYSANWHPMTWLSHMLDCTLFGLHPSWHHLSNLLFHCANAIALFLILNAMTHAMWKSWFVAVLFALHPMHVESVAWIAERKDVLSTLFFFCTIACYLWYLKKQTTVRYLSVVACFILGLMAKPMLVTVPCVLLLLDYWPLRRIRFFTPNCDTVRRDKKIDHLKDNNHEVEMIIPAKHEPTNRDSLTIWGLIIEKLPLFLLSTISCIITYIAQQKSGAINPLSHFSVTDRLVTTACAYVSYLEKLLLPINLSCFYPQRTIPQETIIISIVCLLIVSVVCIASLRNRSYLLIGWLWFLGTFVPVIGLIKIGNQYIADRYTYVPSIGIFVMLVWGIHELFAKFRKGKTLLATGALLILFAMLPLTWSRCKVWLDAETLWTDAVQKAPDAGLAHFNLGGAFVKKGLFEKAAYEFERAALFNFKTVDTYNNLAYALTQIGNPAQAVESCKEALRIDSTNTVAYCYMGEALTKLGKLDEAILAYETALRIDPRYGPAYYYLGAALFDSNRIQESIHSLTEALRFNYKPVQVYHYLVYAYTASGNPLKVVENCKEVLRLDLEKYSTDSSYGTTLATTYNNLGEAYALSGNYAEAIHNYAKALDCNPQYPTAHFNLGLALKKQGNLDEAIRYFQESIRLKPDFTDAKATLNLAITERDSSVK